MRPLILDRIKKRRFFKFYPEIAGGPFFLANEKKRDETLRVEAKRLKRLPSVKKLRFFRTSRLTI